MRLASEDVSSRETLVKKGENLMIKRFETAFLVVLQKNNETRLHCRSHFISYFFVFVFSSGRQNNILISTGSYRNKCNRHF